ncbi:MAG: flagellar biosynthetic protein FliO [Planctomycetota bacterium]
MPTTRHFVLLLLATFPFAGPFTGSSWAQGTSDGSVEFDWPERMRPGASSVGPRSAARKTDQLVEPASFQAAVTPRLLPDTPPHHDELTADIPLREATGSHDSETPTPKTPAPERQPATTLQPADGGRRLGSESGKPVGGSDASTSVPNPLEGLLAWRPTSQQLTATGGGLAIAVGLLLSTIWLIRSCAPKSSRPLPTDVVEVLGRAPLGAKQTTQLVRVGSKLVLIAVTPDGAKTLTEVTDPGEVQRLIAACESSSGRGSAADFDDMLQQLSNEPADRGFLGKADRDDPLGFADAAFDPRSLAAAYANTPGGRGDG